MAKTVREIVREYLSANGYAGLMSDEGCGCSVDDFMPCCSCDSAWLVDCYPGYAGRWQEGHDVVWGIVAEKQEAGK